MGSRPACAALVECVCSLEPSLAASVKWAGSYLMFQENEIVQWVGEDVARCAVYAITGAVYG